MERRTLLRLSGVGALGTVGLSGCLDDFTGGLEVTSVDHEITLFNNIELLATVENTSSDRESGTLEGEVDIHGSDLLTNRQNVAVDGDTSRVVDLHFDVRLGDQLTGGDFTYEARIED